MFEWSNMDKIVLPVALVIVVALTTILYFAFRDRSKNIRKIPLYVITALLLALEVANQIYHIAIGYHFATLPLHFHSIVLFAFPLMLWAGGHFQKVGNALSIIVVSLVVVCFYLSPDLMIGNAGSNMFANFQSFYYIMFFHLSFLYFFTAISLDLFDWEVATIVYFWLGFAFYSVIMVIFANVFSVYFVNCLENVVSILAKFRVDFGMLLYSVVMYLVCMGIGGVIFIVERAVFSRINHKN